jgi:ferric-dicitrate binding protein FerR (iron transport regulator)
MTEIGFDTEKIINYFKGKSSDKGESYVKKVFCDDNNEMELRSLLSRQFDESLLEEDMVEKNLDHILHSIHYEINTRLSAQKVGIFDSLIKWTLRIAGVIILPIAIFIGIQMHREASLKKDAWVEIKSPEWARVQFSLPDGTTGWLNSNSSVKYNENFIADRHVTLKGEAFFDVFKDKKNPFIVTANEIAVKVLGTRFNIASYENEKTIEVVLEEGKLVFYDNAKKNSYTMKPNDLVIYDKSDKDFITEVVQSKKYVSWKDGILIFRNDPLDVVANKLERWFNIEVVNNVSLAKDIRLRATFNDESLEDVLNLLKLSLPIDYRVENRGINPAGTYLKKKVILIPRTK